VLTAAGHRMWERKSRRGRLY